MFFVLQTKLNGVFVLEKILKGIFSTWENIEHYSLYLRKYSRVFFVLEKKFNGVFLYLKKLSRVKNVLQIFVEGIKLYWNNSDDGKNTVGKP